MSFFKRRWPIIILLFIVVVLLAVLLSKKPPIPSPTPPPSNPAPISSNHNQKILTINFSAAARAFQPPPTLAQYTTDPLDPQTYAASLAQTLGLPPHPQSNHLWVKDIRGINLTPENGLITYTNNVARPSSSGLDPQKAADAAQQFVRSLGITDARVNQSNVLLLQNVTDYMNAKPQNNVPPANASLMVIPFYYTINELPFYYSSLPRGTLNVVVNNKYQVIKTDLTPPSNKVTEISTHPPIDLQTAANYINSPQSTILSFESTDPTNQEDITFFQINQTSLEYRLNPNTNTILPYYFFSGTADTSSEKNIPTSVIVQAI